MERKQVRIEYTQSPDFKDIFVTGAHGGVGPAGDIYFVLVTERTRLPEADEILLDEQGHPLEVRHIPSAKGSHVREAMVGVHMSPENAETLARWLLQTVDERRRRHPLLPSGPVN